MKLQITLVVGLLAVISTVAAKPTAANQCSKQEEGQTYGIPSDCHKYTVCKKGELKVKSCESKYSYDVVTSKCVKVSKATCATEPSVEEPQETDEQYDFLCTNVLFGIRIHPQACDKYISCSGEKAKIELCADGQIFRSEVIGCVAGDKVSCEPLVVEPSTTASKPDSGESTESGSGNNSGESTETGNGNNSGESTETGNGNNSGESTENGNGNNSGESNEPGTNPEDPAGQYDYVCANVLLGTKPHPETCQKYISCYKSKAKEENCKKGYAYSTKLHLCVKQKGDSCVTDPEVPVPTVQPPTASTSSSESGESNETGNGNNSGESNETGNGNNSGESTETGNGNNSGESTENGNNSGESNEPGTNPEEPAGQYDYVCANVLLGTKPHPDTCQKYISCYKSKAKEENCKKGYAYSTKLHLCVKQKGDSCVTDPEGPVPTVQPPTASTSSSESGESNETGNGNNSGESTENGNGNNSGESTETGNGNNSGESNEPGTNPEEPAGQYDYVCANILLGTKPHPETCQKYISCFKSKAKEENCKKGYAYSTKLHLCVKQKGDSCVTDPEVPVPTVQPPTASTSSSESGESNETGNGNNSGESTENGNGNNSGESTETGNGNNSGESNEPGTNPEDPAGQYDYVCANVLLGTKPHPDTCQKYISCYKSKAKEENCKKGYAYSTKLHLCVKQKGDSCVTDPEVPVPTVQPPTASTSSSESGESNETGNGNNSGESTENGNGNNSGESTETGNGNHSGESNEPGTNPEEPAGQYDYVCANVLLGTKPHPETCQKYISCYKSKAKEENCKKGYAYSTKLHLCVKQKGDSCNQEGPGTEPTTVTTELVTEPETETQPQTDAPTTTETTTLPTTTTTELSTEVETESEPQPEPTPPSTGGDPSIPSCEGDFTGYLTIENDCAQYVYCFQGEPSVKNCLENYIYYAPFSACLPGDPVTCQLYSA